MQRDSAETECAKQDRESLRLVHGAGEYYGGLTGELGEQVYEVKVFIFIREEEVVLQQGVDGLVLVCGDTDADGVLEGGALQGFDFRGHCCAEEVGVAAFSGEDFEDFVEDGAEVEVEESICFVHY